MDEYQEINIAPARPLGEWARSMHEQIELLQWKMKRYTSKPMSDLEAWQYYAWVQSNIIKNIAIMHPENAANLATLGYAVSEHCSNRYQIEVTGKLPPPKPGDVHFDHPPTPKGAVATLANETYGTYL